MNQINMPDNLQGESPSDSAPRYFLALAYLLAILNLGEVYNLSVANILVKGLFLISALTFLNSRNTSKNIIVLMACNIILVVLFGGLTSYPNFSWLTLIFSINQFIIIYAMLAIHPLKADSDFFLRAASWLPVACVILGYIYDLLGLHALWGQEYGSGTIRLKGSVNAAFLSGFAMCGIYAALLMAINQRKKLYFVYVIANFVILILAGGRAALLAALIVSSSSIVFSRSISSSLKFITMVFGIIILLLIFLSIGEGVLERILSSGDNGRSIMWNYLMSVHDDYPWTGIGWGHQFLSVPEFIEISTGSTAAHNDYIRLLVELGLIGMPIFYLLLVSAVAIAAFRNKYGVNYPILLSFVAFLLLSYSDNALASPAYFPLLIISVMDPERLNLRYRIRE